MSTPLFESAKKIYESALEAVRPEKLLGGKILRDGDRLIVGGEIVETGGSGSVDLLAIGKASPGMAGVLTGILGDLVRGGLIIGLPGSDPGLKNLEFQPGAHPLPDARSVTAGRAALALAGRTGPGRHRRVLASWTARAGPVAPTPRSLAGCRRAASRRARTAGR